jgi:hypothetical protein
MELIRIRDKHPGSATLIIINSREQSEGGARVRCAADGSEAPAAVPVRAARARVRLHGRRQLHRQEGRAEQGSKGLCRLPRAAGTHAGQVCFVTTKIVCPWFTVSSCVPDPDWIQSQWGSLDPDSHSECRRAKITLKNREKIINFIF